MTTNIQLEGEPRTVTAAQLVDRLAAHRTLACAPRAELQWLAAHGTLRTLATGDILSAKGTQIQNLFIILHGRLALFVDRNGVPNKLMEWGPGDVSGLLPYSRLVTVPGSALALEPLEVLAIARADLPEMTRECYEVTATLVHTMLDRTRQLTAADLQDEKLISLGKLSAGLAHELNNPASAIERSASTLTQRIQQSEQSTCDLVTALLGAAPATALTTLLATVRAACRDQADCTPRSPLDQMDHEDAIADWLSRHGLDPALSGPLADTTLSVETLEQLIAALPQPSWQAALQWVAAGTDARTLATQIQDCSTRISRLVNAVKGFTRMDQANLPQNIDLAPGLHNTIAVLSPRAQERSIAITLTLAPDLPSVRVYAAELNQIWSNLIDNALDFVASGGHIQILTALAPDAVLVHIVDDGPGIPLEIRDRIFDPFFTTKPQGQGVGLGLDIARRLVRHNDGAIVVESIPGHTRFTVRLPLTA